MADVVINTTATDTPLDTENLDKTPILLRYPTIDLKTSFESLLSNSTSSSSTVSMPRPSGLDESWASLDTSDFSHDEDLQSETAETGSLVDFSSNHDGESENAIEDDIQSEANLDNDRATSMIAGGVSHDDHHPRLQKHDTDEDEAIEDTIIMQRSQVQETYGQVELEHTRSLPSSTVFGQTASKVSIREVISMTISKHPLKFDGKPFSIAYYGTASAHETKDELLGKIGAALVVGSAASDPRSTPSSPVFNIVPTEFGPGSKPAFADLIPSQAQMTVEDVALLKPTPKDSNSIKIGFKRGVVLESTKSIHHAEPHNGDAWRPDLLVVQVSRDDAAEDYYTVKEVFELARRHRWPTITVTKDAPNGLCPTYGDLGITVTQEIETDEGVEEVVQPIDLDSFIAIDTDQLNHHLQYLIEQNFYMRAMDSSQSMTTVLQKLRTFILRPFLTDFQGAKPVKTYVLNVVESGSRRVHRRRRKTSFLEDLGLYCSTINARQAIKDIFLTLTVMVLATYILSFSHGLTQRSNIAVDPAQSTTSLQKGSDTATVTATIKSTTSNSAGVATNVPSIEYDIVLDNALSFDQVWNRLTGRPVGEQQQQQQQGDHGTQEEKPEQIEDKSSKDGKYKTVTDTFESLLNTFKAVTGPEGDERPREPSLKDESRQKLPSDRAVEGGKRMRHKSCTPFSDNFIRGEKVRPSKQVQIQGMYQKLSDRWTHLSKDVQDLGKQSQEHFHDLVKQSQQHLRRARAAGEEHLDKLIKEQKRLLFRAQHQAGVLAHELPQRKKRSLLSRHRF